MIDNIEQRKKDLEHLIHQKWQDKVDLTIAKLMEFYIRTDGNCYISCSGGADSIVLYDIAKKVEKLIDAKFKVVFDDTGLEEPTVRYTALSIPNITVVKPQMPFIRVLTEIGYPIISKEVSECVDQARKCLDNPNRERDIYRLEKLLGTAKQKDGTKSKYNKEKYKCLINAPFRISNQCCNVMKKKPMSKLKEKPIVATMTEESQNRKTAWYKTGCNSFGKKTMSRPMSFWTKQDTLNYIRYYKLDIAKCYGEVIEVDDNNYPTLEGFGSKLRFSGVQRTG